MTALTVLARHHEAGGVARDLETRGQVARTLLALVAAGPRGLTAIEASSWAFRLAAYCHTLRRDYGLVIRTDREEHLGGWHGRHVLKSSVEVLVVEGDEAAA